jgi:glycosyltransferase involved in cell wall biosynthesis
MLNGKKICVVMPGYNAEATVRKTYSEIDRNIVDDVLLVDDGSTDRTAEVSRSLGVHTIVHQSYRGYGCYQKTC